MSINLICMCYFMPIPLRLIIMANLSMSSPSQDTIKLSRESHDVQTLRSDVEAVKRRLLVQTDRPSIAATGLPGLESARRRALFPPELRENISNWVQNRTKEMLGISEKSWKLIVFFAEVEPDDWLTGMQVFEGLRPPIFLALPRFRFQQISPFQRILQHDPKGI